MNTELSSSFITLKTGDIVSMQEVRTYLKKIMKEPVAAATLQNLREQSPGNKNFSIAYQEAFDSLYPPLFDLAIAHFNEEAEKRLETTEDVSFGVASQAFLDQ